jgi:hypothetical protein
MTEQHQTPAQDMQTHMDVKNAQPLEKVVHPQLFQKSWQNMNRVDQTRGKNR